MYNELLHIAYIGLGSNQDNPVLQLRRALKLLQANTDSCRILRTSRFYQTSAWGYTEQADFVNAVCEIQTLLNPDTLMQHLLQIEQQCGRQRNNLRWGPRCIDLDLLLYDTDIWVSDVCCVPHLQMVHRAFVLVPLAELSPLIEIPGHGNVTECLTRLSMDVQTDILPII